MRYFIDTEFREHSIALISIGIVAEDGRELYRESQDIWSLPLSDWLREHVVPHLRISGDDALAAYEDGTVTAPGQIARDVRAFVGEDQAPEFWGYYCAYDYVVLSQLMGGMDDWPGGWPYYMHDLRQWLDERGLHHVHQPDDAPHNALEDARWIREIHRQESAYPGLIRRADGSTWVVERPEIRDFEVQIITAEPQG